MSTSQAVHSFLGSCRARGLSHRTIEWYLSILSRFARLHADLPAQPEPIENFLADIPGLETRHGYFRALRAFYRFTAARSRCPNPMSSVRAPRRRPHPPRTLSLPELGCLLAAPLTPRDRALIELLIDTGIRVGEAISLIREDIREESIEVCGKTGQREVPISDQVRRRLLELQALGPIFRGSKGPLTRSGAYRIVRLALARAGISGKKSGPHLLRHTFGRQYIMAGGDLVSLQRIMGHTDIKTTRIYAELDLADITRQHHRFTPLKSALGASQQPFLIEPHFANNTDDHKGVPCVVVKERAQARPEET